MDVRECTSDADEQVSLDIHNVVWPRQAVTMAEVSSFRSQTRAAPSSWPCSAVPL